MLDNEPDVIPLRDLSWKPRTRAQTLVQSSPYDSEVNEIRARRGDLETIRHNLGLSRKKMAELLLVDASAWTRWTKGISRTPAHVYRSLDWYLKLTESDPQFGDKLKLGQMEKQLLAQREMLQSEMQDLKSELQSENWREEREKLLTQLQSAEKISFAWKAFVLATFVLALL